jgi:hypothetical protein
MEHRLNTIKADLYNVFVEGNANNIQIARVFILVAFPVLSTFLLSVR